MHVYYLIFAELWTIPDCAELLELVQLYLDVLANVLVPKSQAFQPVSVKISLTYFCTGVKDATSQSGAESDPASAEMIKSFSCVLLKVTVSLIDPSLMQVALIKTRGQGMLFGMATFVPVFEGYQPLSRSASVWR